jgi:hypothetical protein
MDPRTVVAILNNVQGNYKKKRIDTIWRGSASLPRYRYPFPYMVPSTGWKGRWLSDTEKVPVVSVNLQGVKFELKLRAGPGFWRQVSEFEQILDGRAKQCQLDIFTERANSSDNRNGGTERTRPGGGERISTNYVVKIIAKFLPGKPAGDNTLFVKTEKDSFVVLSQNNKPIWTENADHVKGWILEHKRRIFRLSEDLKFETRQGKRYPQILDAMTRAQNKFHNRMTSFCHEVSAHIVGKAVRGKCNKVIYDDTERSYFSDFQWFNFTTTLRNKLGAAGIEFCECQSDEKNTVGSRKS